MQNEEIPRKWSHAVAVWWSMAWRIGLWFFVLIAGVIIVTESLFPYNLALQQGIQYWAVVVLLPVLGVYAVHAVLNRNFGRFRLALVPARADEKRRGLFSPLVSLMGFLLRKLREAQADGASQQRKRHKTHAKSDE